MLKRTSPSCLGELMLKRWPELGVDALGEVVDLDGEAGGHGGEDVGVDADAGLLHAQEDGDEREIDGLVDVCSGGGVRLRFWLCASISGDCAAEGWRLGCGVSASAICGRGRRRGGRWRWRLREAVGVGGVGLGGLMDERAVGGAGGDVGQGVRGVRGVDEVALEHDVVADAGEGDAVRREGAEDGFEVVDVLGEGGVFEGFAEAGSVEGDFDGGVCVDGEAEAAGGVVVVRSAGPRAARNGWQPGVQVARRRGTCFRRGVVRVRARIRGRVRRRSLRRWRGRLRRWRWRGRWVRCWRASLVRASARSAAISFGGGFEIVGDGGVVDGGGEVFEQGGEFELGEEVAAGGVVDRLGAHGVEGVLDGHAGVDGDELFGEQDVVAIIL